MSDFIREVDEEYRRDRAAKFLARFQVPLAILVVAIIAGAGGWRWWADRRVATAEAVDARYQAAQRLAKTGKEPESQADFDKIAATGPAGYALLARMRATEVLAAKDPAAAAKAFDAIATDAGESQALRDVARYRGAVLRVDSEDPKAFQNQYGRYDTDGFALRNGMRELLALAAMKRNDYPAAGRYLDAIIIDGAAPGGLRNRAQAYRQLVSAGPATPVASQPGPASVTPVGGPPAEAPAAAAAAPAPTAPTPPAAAPAPPPAAPPHP